MIHKGLTEQEERSKTGVRIRVLILIPNLFYGGAQNSLQLLYDYLRLDSRYDVIVSSFSDESKEIMKTGNSNLNGSYFPLSLRSPGNIITKILEFIARYFSLRGLKKSRDIDVTISFLESANYLNVMTRCRDKVVISSRATAIYDEDIKGVLGIIRKRILMPLLYRRSDQIVAISEGIRDELIRHMKIKSRKIKVIYNSFDISKIRELSRIKERKGPLSIPVIAFHGRLHRQKGIVEFLHVFKSLMDRISVRLIIVGDGPLLGSVVDFFESNKIRFCTDYSDFDARYQVCLTGYIREPYDILANSTVYILPSYYEGFGRSLVEAMACGLPVLASDCPFGPREILAPGTGYNRNLKKSEYTKYGVLMPVLRTQNAYRIWEEALIRIINEREAQEYYREAAYKRSKDFDLNSMQKEWPRLLYTNRYLN